MSFRGTALRKSHAQTHRAGYNGASGGVLHGHSRLGPQSRAGQSSEQGSERSMTKPSPKEVKAIADVGGVPVDAEVAARIAGSIGPAFEGFEPVSGTLPFDLEPATFLLVQSGKAS